MRPRVGLPLPRQGREAPAAHIGAPGVSDHSLNSEALQGWVKTWTWTLAGLFVYTVARWIVDVCIPADPLASAELFRQVPLLVYQMSSAAFFTAFVLNLTSLLFEDAAPKRQLALLSCAIKGAACHTDMLLVTGRAHVVFNAFGALVIPQRYVQWLVTTPTMVYTLSKISDFTPRQTATAIAFDVTMIVSGLLANFLPGPHLKWLMFGISMASFIGVLHRMGRMVYSAVKEHTSASSRRSLLFIYMCTLLIWNLFPLAWVLHMLNPSMPHGEYLNVFANFMAKVLFSSSIMYGNYMTIAQRRLLAQQAAENAHRVRMIRELRDAVTRKDQFMSLMSHELRTPLNGIIQLSDALVRGAGGEMSLKGQHFVKTIKNSSNHLLNIINDILDVAALKEGKLTIKHELCSLAKAVEHVVDIVAPLARKDVTIERFVDARTPLIIADFSRVIQILYNLSGNALKFTHRGTVSVRVAPSSDGSRVTLQVADTGIGITPERIGGIWGAFEQVDMSVTRKYGGTGLGLSIVKQLVEAHEGHIEVQSAEGRGTTFTVSLPVVQTSTRQSLEVQVAESLAKCGHAAAREAALRRQAHRLTGCSGQAPSIEDAILQRRLRSPKRDGPENGDRGNLSGSGQEQEDVLYRRRTQELERENLMGDLQRRIEHKRSMDEARLASRQLDLTEPERLAERDSRSLERLEMQIGAVTHNAAGSGGSGGGRSHCGSGAAPTVPDSGGRLRSDADAVCSRTTVQGLLTGGSDGGGSGNLSYHAWRSGEASRSVTGRRSLTAADAPEAIAAAVAASTSGGSGVVPLDPYEHVIVGCASTDSHVSNPVFVRKLSAMSAGGTKSSNGNARDAFRLGAHARGGGSGGFSLPNSGSMPTTASHLLSELYRAGRESYDEVSSIGAESECDGPRGARRPQKPPLTPLTRPGKLPPSSASLTGNNAAAASAAAPPPGLTLDKLAYSDMYGTVQILSVDDEEVNQIVLEEILTSLGYHFARCMDGLEALEWLCGSDTMPDLILLDCMMPNMSGHEFCATLRKVIPGNVLPVIMVSAKSDEENIVEGLRSGSNDFVRKPYQREELLARIETQLRLKSDSWWLAELVNNVDGRETESMKLLKNILPESIIARMQQGQKFVADSHGHVVILFSDIVGFTSLSSKLPTAEVFLMLSNMFTAFDKLTDRFSVYKVETIGDAYMVAAGHDEDDDKTRKGPPLMRVLGFARAMLDVVRKITAPNGERMRVRIGVHCGPAFAGVIGMKCPRYCFLGDTVNTASRMESTGFPMCIHVSENVYQHHPNAETELQEVGEREVKGKGRMRTYLVKVGAWEQALSDFAARQQVGAAAAAAAQRQQQPPVLGLAAVQQQQQHQAGSAAVDAQGSGRGAVGIGGARSAGQLSLSAPVPLTAHQGGWDGNNNTGRFVHLLSTVTEETSVPSSPPPPQAAVTAAATSPSEQQISAAIAARGSGGGFTRLSSTGATGARSPLVHREHSFSRLQPRSTFSSEAYYFEESSEDGRHSTMNGTITVSGMIPSRSESLMDLISASPGAHRHLPGGGGSGAVGELASGSSGVPGIDGEVAAVNGGGVTAHRSVASILGLNAATAAADTAAAQEVDELGGVYRLKGSLLAGAAAATGAAGDGNHLAHLLSGRALGSPGSTGLRAGPGPLSSTIEYLEQRIASLGSQLMEEALKRQKLQADLDDERRRAAAALQQVVLLQYQAVAMAAAGAATATDATGSKPHRAVAAASEAEASRGTGDSDGAEEEPSSHEPQQTVPRPRHQLPDDCGCGISDGQDVEVVILGPADDDDVDDGAARSLRPPQLPVSPLSAPSLLNTPYCTEMSMAGAVTQQGAEDDPRIAAAGLDGGVSVGDGAAAAGANVLGGSRPAPGMPGSHFALVSNAVWHASAPATAAGAAGRKRGGPHPPGGVAQPQLAAAHAAAKAALEEVAAPAEAAGGAVDGDAMNAPSRQQLSLQGTAETLALPPHSAGNSPGVLTAAAGGGGHANHKSSTAAIGGRAVRSLLGLKLMMTATAAASGGAETSSAAAAALQPSWLLPRYSLELLFEELGLLPYLGRFREEAIRLDQLLGMEVGQLEQLGLRPLGYCLRLREAVVDLARGLLRACEEAAMLSILPPPSEGALMSLGPHGPTLGGGSAPTLPGVSAHVH